MRQYTLVFMEQRIGASQLVPMTGEHGPASFKAEDEDAALAYIEENLIQQLKTCVRAELSSLRIMTDPNSATGTRLIDDTHANPNFQDVYVKYDPSTKAVEVDWDSTRTLLDAQVPPLTTLTSRSGPG
jgi:hypothetical protein